MSRVLALHLKPHEATAVVVRTGGAKPAVEAACRVPLSREDAPARRGELIAAALAPWKVGRLPAVIALPRDGLLWQNFQLPPAPDEDLPSLVAMQAQRDLPLDDDGAGFDFLPLEGDAETPRRVLGVGLARTAWERLLETCTAAQIKPRHIVPEAVGWPLLVERQLSAAVEGGVAAHLGVATEPGWAAIWAAASGDVRLLRSVRLPEDGDAAVLATVLAGELRRTRLALGQIHQQAAGADVYLIADHPPLELAERLGESLGGAVRALDARQAFVVEPDVDAGEIGDWASLASLAAATATGERPALDLLNPRRPPAPPTNVRTYSLAAAAALAACALVVWQGYRNLQAPYEAAAVADAERAAIEETLPELAIAERRAALIDRWEQSAAAVLPVLSDVSTGARPQPPSAEDFAAGTDVIITRFNMVGPTLTLDGAAKDAAALQPLETRLREHGYRVDRGILNADASPVPGYGIAFSATLQRTKSTEAAP
ncbi:MAG: hypothetical protein KDA44_21355 [Planctomycetales bacterium]|nr:hypothetical protein [Planctomycetales bacterium]